MNKRLPKRKRDKYNPYKIIFEQETETYFLQFCDSRKIMQCIKISQEIYEIFNKFELEDISQMHKIDKHIEQSELYDETIYKRACNVDITLEEIVENKILNQKLYDAINSLNSIQKRRIIMYYFENKTLREIADIEGCSYVSIKNSIDIAIKKLKIFLK